LVWTYPESPAATSHPQRSCPTIDNQGQIWFCSQNKLVAFREQQGKFQLLWTYETGGRIPGSPVTGLDGNIRIHSGDEHLHIVSPAGERIGNPAKVGEPLGWATPLVDEKNATWICGYHGGLIRVAADGRMDETPFFRGRQRFDSTGLIQRGVLYVGAENACVYAIDLRGERGKNLWDHLAERGRTGWFINSALAVAPGPVLIVASRDDRLYGFQLDGQQLWSLDMDGQMLGSPVVDADGSVYVGLSLVQGREQPRGALVRVDGLSHRIRWRYDTAAPVESTPVIGDDGVVYCGDNDGMVHAVDSDGRAVWTEQVAAAIRSPGTILGQELVVFGLENGTFAALRCSSRKIRPGTWSKYLGALAQSGLVTV